MPIVDLNNKEELKEYEEFVKNAPYTSVTQDVAWSHVKNNWEPIYVYLEENNKISAAMSILTIKNEKENKLFGYCSKGPVCDPTDIDTIDALIKEAKDELKKKNLFLLRMDPEVPYSEKLDAEIRKHGYITRNRNMEKPHDTIQPIYNFVIDIKDKNMDDVIAGMKSNERTKIRKSLKTDVEVVDELTEENLKAFYETYKTMSDFHNITYRPYEYFQRMLNSFDNSTMKVIVAYYEGKPQASAIAFNYGDKIWHMYGGSVRMKNSLLVPYRLQYEMLKWATELHKSRYDMGGVWGTDNSDGLYNFKHRFAKDQAVTEYIGEIDYVLDEDIYQDFLNNH